MAAAAGGFETPEARGIGLTNRWGNRGEDRGGSPKIFFSLSLSFPPKGRGEEGWLCLFSSRAARALGRLAGRKRKGRSRRWQEVPGYIGFGVRRAPRAHSSGAGGPLSSWAGAGSV